MEAHRTPVSEIMRTEFLSVGSKERLDFADRVLRLGNFRHLPVVEDGRLVGILSNRDVLAAALTKLLDFEAGQRRTFLHSVEVSEVMTRDVVSVRPDTPLSEAALRMVERKVGCLPVVDQEDKVLGLVTETDLLRAAYLAPAE